MNLHELLSASILSKQVVLKALNGLVVNDVSSVSDLVLFMVSNHNFMQLLNLLQTFHYLTYIWICHASNKVYTHMQYLTNTLLHILPSQVTLCELIESCFCDTHFEVSMLLNDSSL